MSTRPGNGRSGSREGTLELHVVYVILEMAVNHFNGEGCYHDGSVYAPAPRDPCSPHSLPQFSVRFPASWTGSYVGGCGYHSHSGSSQSSENSILSKMVPVVASVSKKQKLHVPFCPFHTPSITGSNPLPRISLLRSFMGTFLQSKAICCTPPSPRLLVISANGLYRESIHLPGLNTPPSDCLRVSAA